MGSSCTKMQDSDDGNDDDDDNNNNNNNNKYDDDRVEGIAAGARGKNNQNKKNNNNYNNNNNRSNQYDVVEKGLVYYNNHHNHHNDNGMKRNVFSTSPSRNNNNNHNPKNLLTTKKPAVAAAAAAGTRATSQEPQSKNNKYVTKPTIVTIPLINGIMNDNENDDRNNNDTIPSSATGNATNSTSDTANETASTIKKRKNNLTNNNNINTNTTTNIVRQSLVRVGSRLRMNYPANNNNSGSMYHKPPASPAARVSNYNHVLDAVAMNFKEALSERGISAVPMGIVGFKNMGNTCYLNSSLQCLSATIPLTDYFLGYDYRSEINKSNPLGTGGNLATEYAQLMKLLWLGAGTNNKNNNNKNSSGGGKQGNNNSNDSNIHNKNTITTKNLPIEPYAFKKVLEKFATQFRGNDQHDSQELLSYLLDGIHEDLNRIKNKPYIEDKDCDGTNDENDAIDAWKNYLRRNKSLIVDLFQGQLRNEMQCLTCKHKNIRFEPFMYLSLPIQNNSNHWGGGRSLLSSSSSSRCNIQDCLNLFLKKEVMNGDNQWYCSKCKTHRDATKQIDLWVLPPILIVHLKRFRFNEHGSIGSKNSIPIDYPITSWDLTKFVKSKGSELPMYDLYAVSNHVGGLGSGHYTAYTQSRFNDEWYEFNDSRYRLIQPSELYNNSSSAYVLFFNRVTNAIHQPSPILPEHEHSPSKGSVESSSNGGSSVGGGGGGGGSSRVPLIRRQSVSRPDLWPHTQVQNSRFRGFARSSLTSPSPVYGGKRVVTVESTNAHSAAAAAASNSAAARSITADPTLRVIDSRGEGLVLPAPPFLPSSITTTRSDATVLDTENLTSMRSPAGTAPASIRRKNNGNSAKKTNDTTSIEL